MDRREFIQTVVGTWALAALPPMAAAAPKLTGHVVIVEWLNHSGEWTTMERVRGAWQLQKANRPGEPVTVRMTRARLT